LSRHILIVEDEQLIACVLEEFLAEDGYRVTLAPDGEKAFGAWQREAADLVIADLSMPGTNGVELIDRIRRTAEAIPVLAVTDCAALAPDVEKLRTDSTARTVVLEKPFRLAQVHEAVQHLLA
jgi:two-component system, OmpR family, phosphate regulon response regulator OmpR